MKLRAEEMQNFLDSVNNAADIVRNEDGRLQSFSYMKYYGTTKRTAKKISVSIKSSKEQAKKTEELDEKQFYNQLADNIKDVTDIKLHCDKIYKYTLNGQRYKTVKSDTKKLFDFMPYKDFIKVTRQRFWNKDNMLRNGYFSGMIGTNNDAIRAYLASPKEYELYDVDFNAAYPYCFKMPLPTDKFYTLPEWETVKDNFAASMRFYRIKIKTIVNPFKVFIPPAPYVEYKDFDFLMQKTNSNMIVSEQRLSLIKQVYGSDAFIIKCEYVCPVKVYLKLADFSQQLYDDIQKAKADGNETLAAELKIALNSLVGNFGKRDESRTIKGLRLVDSGVIKNVIAVQWTDAEYKQQQNYLPLSMVINDITARRLFDMMTDKNALRLCYNTDGGIVALRKGCRIVTSDRIGRLKAKRIYSPVFLYTTMLYNRPLVYDKFTKKIYNSKSIYYDETRDIFMYGETMHLNTRDGFIAYENEYPIVTEPFTYENFRKNEMITRLSGNKLYVRLVRYEVRSTGERRESKPIDDGIIRDVARAFEKLCNPYDENYNEIRHAPPQPDVITMEQIKFDEKFFKFDKNNH